MRKLLLTGATGFIGKACLGKLQQVDVEVHAIYHRRPPINQTNVIWHHCDILNQADVSKLVKEIRPDYLIHLAWIVEHRLFWTAESNVEHARATRELYNEFSLQGGKKAILIGTCAEYDRTHTYCDEQTTPLNPDTLYGKCKKQTLEDITQLKANHPNYAEFCWVRLFNIYGPHEHQDRLIPYIFLSFLQNTVPMLSHPHAIRDHIYVENLAEILIHLVSSETDRVINIGSGKELSIAEITKLIHAKFFKHQISFENKMQAMNVEDRLVPNLSRLESLNISLTTSFETSLEKTYHWWSSSLNNKFM